MIVSKDMEVLKHRKNNKLTFFKEYKYYNGKIYKGKWQQNKLNDPQAKEIMVDKTEFYGSFENGVKKGNGQFNL